MTDTQEMIAIWIVYLSLEELKMREERRRLQKWLTHRGTDGRERIE